MPTSPHTVADILDSLDELSDEDDKVSLGQIMDAFGARTYGPMIMLPALLELTPVGAIPGVPSFLALTIMVIAAQKMIGKRHPWLPGLISNRTISSDKLSRGSGKLRPMARFMDKYFHRRLKFMTRAPFAQIAAGLVILLCLTVPFLEVLPFASSVPMLAIAGFGLAVLVRDGVAMIVALLVSVAALGMGLDYWDGGMSDTEEVDGMVDQNTVDTVKDGASEAGAAAKKAGEAAKQAGEEMERAADEAGKKLEEAADETGEKIRQAAEDAGQKASDTIEGE